MEMESGIGLEYGWAGEMSSSVNETTRIQQALKTLLNLPLAVDGVMGSNTKRAMKLFQTLWSIPESQTKAFLFQMHEWVKRPSNYPAVMSVAPFQFDNANIDIGLPPKIAIAAKKAFQMKGSGNRPMNILLIGHADKVGSESYNLKLGMNRATTVAQHLHTAFECLARNSDEAHWMKKCLKWASAGEFFPLPGSADFSRRVEIIILPVPPNIYP